MPTPTHFPSCAAVRMTLSALLSLLALALGATSASAEVPDAPWTGTGNPAPTVADGTGDATEAKLEYTSDQYAGGWEFAATATKSGEQHITWLYEGLHSWADVTASVVMFVVRDGETTTKTLVAEGPVDCCTTPSNGFFYHGRVTFDLQVGDRYGF
jgi:hypothetical protein